MSNYVIPSQSVQATNCNRQFIQVCKQIHENVKYLQRCASIEPNSARYAEQFGAGVALYKKAAKLCKRSPTLTNAALLSVPRYNCQTLNIEVFDVKVGDYVVRVECPPGSKNCTQSRDDQQRKQVRESPRLDCQAEVEAVDVDVDIDTATVASSSQPPSYPSLNSSIANSTFDPEEANMVGLDFNYISQPNQQTDGAARSSVGAFDVTETRDEESVNGYYSIMTNKTNAGNGNAAIQPQVALKQPVIHKPTDHKKPNDKNDDAPKRPSQPAPPQTQQPAQPAKPTPNKPKEVRTKLRSKAHSSNGDDKDKKTTGAPEKKVRQSAGAKNILYAYKILGLIATSSLNSCCHAD